MAAGGILSWLVLYQPIFAIPSPAHLIKPKYALTYKYTKDFLAFLGLAILIVVFFSFSKDTVFPGKNALLPVVATMFIIIAGPSSFLNRTILSNKFVVWFGLISFPLYLWHWPILSFARIIYGEIPAREFRFCAILVSILLAWLTVKFIELPFRFRNENINKKILFLTTLLAAIAGAGLLVVNSDGYLGRKNLKIRWNLSDIIGMSDRWYRGSNDWLFLGNAYDKTVSKLKLSIHPTPSEVKVVKDSFANLAEKCAPFGTKVVLIVGPNKSSIYPEQLPSELKPAATEFIEPFLTSLREIPNLTVYNPTNDLLNSKTNNGVLYWMTDTHWNNRGAYVTFTGFSKLIGMPTPKVTFAHSSTRSGDLIGISGLKNFPLHIEDNWDVIWDSKPSWSEKEIPFEQKTTFGNAAIVTNPNALSNKRVWIIGDSFTVPLRQYFNATYKEVHYLGHWGKKLNELPMEYLNAETKPDIIIVVRVERSF